MFRSYCYTIFIACFTLFLPEISFFHRQYYLFHLTVPDHVITHTIESEASPDRVSSSLFGSETQLTRVHHVSNDVHCRT